jgi:uroporphyrinogen decarboxylase
LIANDRFLKVAHGEGADCTPIWFMRQAGRSLPEYREMRTHHSILELCREPELAAEVTMQPVRRLGVDAAILFSDIVVPLQGMGIEVDIHPGVGPVIANPIRDAADVERLRILEPESDVPFVLETIKLLVRDLDVPLIGFGGAPFTLASYMIEGGPSKNYARTKAFMYGEPSTWDQLMEKLAASVLAYLRAQAISGAHAIQLFDSWVGQLPPLAYEVSVAPAVRHILDGLSDLNVPRILFGVGTGELLADMAATNPTVIGVDWRTPLDAARERIGRKMVVQGNLDPAICLAEWDVVSSHAGEVLARGGGANHIFNLGHGVLPETDPDTLRRLVDFVHEWKPDA